MKEVDIWGKMYLVFLDNSGQKTNTALVYLTQNRPVRMNLDFLLECLHDEER